MWYVDTRNMATCRNKSVSQSLVRIGLMGTAISLVLEKLNGGFKNNKFFLLKPTICDNNTRPQLLLSSDITAPQANNVDILID